MAERISVIDASQITANGVIPGWVMKAQADGCVDWEANTFVGLSDTPSSIIDCQFLKGQVNSSGSSLIFYDLFGGDNTWTGLNCFTQVILAPGIFDKDQDTGMWVEKTTDEDIIRFDLRGFTDAVVWQPGDLEFNHTSQFNAPVTVGFSGANLQQYFQTFDQNIQLPTSPIGPSIVGIKSNHIIIQEGGSSSRAFLGVDVSLTVFKNLDPVFNTGSMIGYNGFISRSSQALTTQSLFGSSISVRSDSGVSSVMQGHGAFMTADNTTVTDLRMYYGTISTSSFNGGGSITNAYGFQLGSLNVDALTAITNFFGLHLPTATGSANITNYFGIFQEDPGAVNVFEGGILIGGDTTSLADVAINNNGNTVFNNQENAVDFRIAGDTVTSLFFVDGSEDRIGIGTNSPNEIFHVNGNFRLSEASASHEYNITLREVIGLTSVAWQNQSSGTESAFEMYTKDGDGTDGCLFRFFSIGIPTDIVPGNYFEMGYVVGVGYVVRSQHLSSVSLPVSLGTVEGLHLTVNTTGEIDILNGELDMNSNSIGFIEQVISTQSGGTASIDWKNGNKASMTLDQNITMSMLDPSRPGNFILKINQASGSNFTITWDFNVKWPRGVTPSLTPGPSEDVIAFYFDGNEYYGVITKDFS